MISKIKKYARPFSKPLIVALLFILFFAMMWWRGAYNFCYLEQFQTFVYDGSTVCRLLHLPGGCVQVAALWVIQFFAKPLLGIAIMAALLTAITLTIDALLFGKSFNPLSIAPAVALMVLHYNVNYQFAGTLAFLLLLLLLLPVKLVRRAWLKAVCALVAAVVVVLVAGTLILPWNWYNPFLPLNNIVYMPWAVLLAAFAISFLLERYGKHFKQLIMLLWAVALAFSFFCATVYINPMAEQFKQIFCQIDDNHWDERLVNYNLANKGTPYFKAILSETYFRMGQNGSAMHYAFEANESFRNLSPRMLKMLVRTNIKQGEPEVAKKYLTVLSRTLFYKQWATEQMAFVRKTFKASQTAPIFPDYTGVTIPKTIAPLSFSLAEGVQAEDVSALFTTGSEELTVAGKEGVISMADKDWQRLTAQGGEIKVQVKALQKGVWREYNTFSIYVSDDEIDPYIAYRLIEPGYQTWSEMGIYQRCLQNYDETEILINRETNYGCMNCHSFHKQNPDNLLFHLRVDFAGTYMQKPATAQAPNSGNSSLQKLNLDKPLVYPSWHPSGNYVAFSRNNTQQIFHPTDKQRVEVFDNSSDVVVLNVNTEEVMSCPLLSSETAFETFPTFSADGKTLYFCTADSVNDVEHNWQRVHYSLCSIAFNPDDGSFGETVDTLFNAKTNNKSISFPRVSPDGQFLMFTLHSCGNFSIWHRDADLWMMHLTDSNNLKTPNTETPNPRNVETPNPRNLEVLNSQETESYHSWSSNSRWVVFSSRRLDGLYTRPYIAHIDKQGNPSKPFLLPQSNPDYYTFLMKSYNIPEFIRGEVQHVKRIWASQPNL